MPGRLPFPPVNVVNPLVGGLPDDGPDPQGEVGGHEVHEAEAGEHAELLDYHLWKLTRVRQNCNFSSSPIHQSILNNIIARFLEI